MAAPVVAATGANAHRAGNGTLSIPVPASVASGSLIIAAFFIGLNNAPASTTLAGPTGAGTWLKGVEYLDTTTGFWCVTFFKYATGADSGTYAFVLANDSTGAAVLGGDGYAFRVTGGPTSGWPFADSPRTKTNGPTGATSLAMSSFTPGGANTLLLALHNLNSGTITVTTPSGWTLLIGTADTTNGVRLSIYTLGQTTAAAVAPTFTSSSSTQASVLIIGIRILVASEHVGSNTPSAMYLGATRVGQVYKGTNLVFG